MTNVTIVKTIGSTRASFRSVFVVSGAFFSYCQTILYVIA